MNSSFDRTVGNETWLTPKWLLDLLGDFDLDPCCPENMPWGTAKSMYTELDNGLLREWVGRCWVNPPYGNETGRWLEKCVLHGNCMALIFARTETKMFFRYVWDRADAVLFISGRLKFCRIDGSEADSAGAPSVLVAYGAENVEMLRGLKIGKFIELK